MKQKKTSQKAPQPRGRKKQQKKKPQRFRFALVMLGLAVAAMIGVYYFLSVSPKPEQAPYLSAAAPVEEPRFVKEGELRFLRGATGETIAQIDIEVADTPFEIRTGLMHRRSMPASAGMLFIFPSAGQRMFWMKNTYIPLDILFIDEDKKIHRIEKGARPLSEAFIPSRGETRYVVEVNAGFCEARDVRVGDKIAFK